MPHRFRVSTLPLPLLFVVCTLAPSVSAQRQPRPSAAPAPASAAVDRFLAPAYPFELVSAARADRIAWLAYERGRRNVYAAAAPAFSPVRVTRHLDDDGIDLTNLQISADGSLVVFVRGHAPNRDGWVANPTSDPRGAERTIWAARTSGGAAWRLGPGAEPALSPDGSAVLFAKEGQIYRYRTAPAAPARGAEPKPNVQAWGINGNPTWSPDGRKFAFVSDRGDHSFIAVYDVAARRLSYMSPSVDHDTSPTWSADSTRLAFLRRPGTPFGQQSQAGGAGVGNAPGPANTPAGRGRGQGRGQGGRGGRGDDEGPGIPGLTRAVFKGGYTVSFWVADAANGEAREVWHSKPNDQTFARVNAIEWAGDHLIFSAEPEEWIRYYSVSASGGTVDPATLTPGEGMVEHIAISRDGRHLYYATNAGDIDRRHVWKVPTAGGEAVQITKGQGIETYPAALASGRHLALLSAGAARPQSVGLVPAAGGQVRILFPSLAADFPVAEHVVPENVTLTAEDGVKFNNQLFVPRNIRSGERRPAIVFVHGGPVRQMLLGYHYRHFYHMAYGVNQWLASQGYVVMSVNYRRGIGYGRSFRTAPNTGGGGNAEYRDVLAAGKYLQGRADVDSARIGIWGLSYGGVLTAQALARNSDIFKVGVDLAGVHLWGSSIEPDSVSYRSSVIGAIETWKSPVLLVHGDDDRNVAFSQTTGLVQLLRARGIHHELIVFPDDVHDSLLYGRWIYTFDRMDAFIRRFIGQSKVQTNPESTIR
jgi:dipeptidyl aminopeptidase/acylaminoacyl peptidase